MTLLKVYLALLVSTALCERGLSTIKRFESDWRTGPQLSPASEAAFSVCGGPTVAIL